MPEAADAERPADSLHNPPGGPSTSGTSATLDPPSDLAPSEIATPTQAIGGTSPNSSTAQQKGVKALQDSTSTSSEPTADTGNKSSSSSSSSSSLTDIDWDSAADIDTSSVSSQEDCHVDSPGEEDSAAEQSQRYVVLAMKLKSGRVG